MGERKLAMDMYFHSVAVAAAVGGGGRAHLLALLLAHLSLAVLFCYRVQVRLRLWGKTPLRLALHVQRTRLYRTTPCARLYNSDRSITLSATTFQRELRLWSC